LNGIFFIFTMIDAIRELEEIYGTVDCGICGDTGDSWGDPNNGICPDCGAWEDEDGFCDGEGI
jgi:hypothetical protein